MGSLLNIQHSQTTAYHPQSNDMAKRFHHGLKDALHAPCAAANWVDHLPWVLLGLGAAAREDNGTTLLRQCPAYHSLYLANFCIHLNYLQKIFFNDSRRH